MSNLPYLPYEITEQILLRLPARSLLRFNVVCKQWQSSISDPIFVKDHANLALLDQSNKHCKVITGLITSEDDSSRQSMISQSIDYETLNSTYFQFEFETQISPPTLCCCNGLLLCDSRVLWNPLLSKKYNFFPPCERSISTLLHGLGYSISLDDYKVVKLNRKNRKVLEAQVYSLKTNSWKVAPVVRDILDLEYACVSSKAGTHVQESIYWIISDYRHHNNDQKVIVSFNLITDEFKLIETPWGKEDISWPLELVNVRGYLGFYGPTPVEVVIWIWNEDKNTQGYWTKLLTIPKEYPKKTRVLSFMNNNEVLLYVREDTNSHRLVIYDTACMMFRDIPCGKGGWFRWPMHHMVETLVSPISGDR